MQFLPAITEEAGFEKITVVVRQAGHYWQFKWAGNMLVSYWPGHSKAQLRGDEGFVPCASAPRARFFAERTKKRLVAVVAAALRPAVPHDD